MTAFTLTVADGSLVLSVLAARDDADGWSRDLPVPSVIPALTSFRRKRVAVPRSDQLGFAPESEYSAAWAAVLDLLGDADAEIVELDFSEFFAVGELLYSGPWLAERLSGIEEFTTAHPDSLNPVVRELLERGAGFTGTEVFRGIDDIELARRSAARRFAAFDVVMTPTTPTTFTIEEMVADPIVRNAALGRFTTFGNLLDMAAVAVPAGFTATGMPFGVSVLGSAGTDAALLGFAGALESLFGLTLGATPFYPTELPHYAANPEAMTVLRLAVVGAHLAGMPLNWQLAELGAVLERVTTTSKQYRLFALANTSPPKPGLVKVDVEGAAIEVEVYRVPSPRFAEFIARVGSPLAIGTISLIDGSSVHGFVCEPWGIDGANDVTRFGGWRAYIDAVNH